MAAKAGMPVDMELKKAFQELQIKMINSKNQIKISDAQIEALKRTIQHSKLVYHELSSLAEETRLYEGVGRMFILQPPKEIKNQLDSKMKASEEKIESLQKNKTYLERNIKESEDNLREMITSRQMAK
ncbi:prefoldin subunit 1-like [Mytilus galloprovincialis]|uniref:Prefoldin subunit 1 n=1 Tax=Mytilus galloprovincialis TaxID=29158 RepID=A0A8B6GLG4_MYTGA|nr:prefoldin subunit 1 [Mytilus galloprovincialis]